MWTKNKHAIEGDRPVLFSPPKFLDESHDVMMHVISDRPNLGSDSFAGEELHSATSPD